MDFGELIYRSLSGGLSSRTEAADLPRMLAAIVKAAGGPGAAARAIGVHPATLRRWRAGQTSPSARSAPLLAKAVRRARLAPGRERRIRAASPSQDVRQRDNGRERTLGPGSLRWDDDASDRLVDAFLDGASPAELRRIFKEGIRDRFYSAWVDADEYDYGPEMPDEDSYGFDVQAITW